MRCAIIKAARFALLGLGLAAGACSEGPPQAQSEDDDEGDDEDESEGETGEPPAPGDRCSSTPLAVEAPATIAATLRNASADELSVCGLSGPTVFAEITLRDRVDLQAFAIGRAYTPRFAVLRPGCSVDPSRVLACGEGLPVTIRDIGPSVELLIAVGIDEADPALELAAADGEPDPLDFELRLQTRAVLGEHARCGPAFGRCESGTVCLPEDEDGVLIDRCRRPPADSCIAPGIVVLPNPGASVVIEIPPDEPHSDAHEHPCTGWRRPERVEQLELPAGLGETAQLIVQADDPRVGLALRGPDCLPESALACAPVTGIGEGTSISFGAPGQLAALAAAGEAPILFIELPRAEVDADPDAAIHVSVELLE